MPKTTEPNAHPRIAMLQDIYQDNLRLGKVGRDARPRRPLRPRHWHARGLFAITLLFGSTFGYMSPSWLGGEFGVSNAENATVGVNPELLEWVQAGNNLSYSPFNQVSFDLAPLDAPARLPGIETQVGADFDMLLRDNLPPLTSLFGLDVKTIVIDPGHGGKDPGAIGANGTLEKDIALDIALRLRDRLRNFGNYKILMTRETDTSLKLNERVGYANDNQADLFISIHVNAFPDVRVKTIETYYFGAPPDDEATHLAAIENADSHYRMAEFKAMIEKIGHTMKHQESASLAASIQYNLFHNIRKLDHDVRSFGVKTAPFVVLLGVDAPSVLAEVSCITNVEEEKKLNSPVYREKIASFIERGVHEYLKHKRSRTAGDNRYERERKG